MGDYLNPNQGIERPARTGEYPAGEPDWMNPNSGNPTPIKIPPREPGFWTRVGGYAADSVNALYDGLFDPFRKSQKRVDPTFGKGRKSIDDTL